MRLLTLNMHKGLDARGHPIDLDDLAAALRGCQADVILLQEAFHAARDEGASQSARLGEALGMHVAYVPNKHRRVGHHGNATLSRSPFEHTAHIDLSTNRLERRGLLHVRIALPHGPSASVLNTHLGLNTLQRRRQLRRIEAYLKHEVDPREALVLGGDFNDWTARLGGAIRRRLGVRDALAGRSWRDRSTYPVGRSRLPLDRFYVRRFRIHQAAVLRGQPWASLSDHLPLALDVRSP